MDSYIGNIDKLSKEIAHKLVYYKEISRKCELVYYDSQNNEISIFSKCLEFNANLKWLQYLNIFVTTNRILARKEKGIEIFLINEDFCVYDTLDKPVPVYVENQDNNKIMLATIFFIIDGYNKIDDYREIAYLMREKFEQLYESIVNQNLSFRDSIKQNDIEDDSIKELCNYKDDKSDDYIITLVRNLDVCQLTNVYLFYMRYLKETKLRNSLYFLTFEIDSSKNIFVRNIPTTWKCVQKLKTISDTFRMYYYIYNLFKIIKTEFCYKQKFVEKLNISDDSFNSLFEKQINDIYRLFIKEAINIYAEIADEREGKMIEEGLVHGHQMTLFNKKQRVTNHYLRFYRK